MKRPSRWRDYVEADLDDAVMECNRCIEDLNDRRRITAKDREKMYDRLERARTWIDNSMHLLEEFTP